MSWVRPLAILAVTLSACASVTPAEQSYSALGTEPFWSIEIAGGRLTYETPDGTFSVPAPAPAATANGRRYQTERITVDVTPWVCTDGMSDNLYADTVSARVDGTTLHGCGGGTVPEDTLINSSWAIQHIGDSQVWEEEDEEAYRLAFRSDRVIGRAGCNGFSGPYSRSGDTLIIGPLAATRMACPPPRMEHERRAFEVLRGEIRLQLSDDDLVLTGPGGTLRLQRSFHSPHAPRPVDPWEPSGR
jgi:heat shock protein HslJ